MWRLTDGVAGAVRLVPCCNPRLHALLITLAALLTCPPQVRTDATSIEQSCIMVHTSGIVAGAVLGENGQGRVRWRRTPGVNGGQQAPGRPV